MARHDGSRSHLGVGTGEQHGRLRSRHQRRPPVLDRGFPATAGSDVLFYYPGDDNWWLGTLGGNGQLGWSLVSNTAGFGHGINDGRPFWIGRFSRADRDEVLFYYPGDDNWWLGTLGGTGSWLVAWWATRPASGTASTTAGRSGSGISTATAASDLFYYPGDDNWWLGTLGGNGQLDVVLGGQHGRLRPRHQRRPPVLDRPVLSCGSRRGSVLLPGRRQLVAGHVRRQRATRLVLGGQHGRLRPRHQRRPPVLDRGFQRRRPHRDVLFYYPGDDNWWLAIYDPNRANNDKLAWTRPSKTWSFGHGINDGRPFWVGRFTGANQDQMLFYYPGDDNWWAADFTA